MAGVYLKNKDVIKAFSHWLDDSMRLKGQVYPLTAHVSSFVEIELKGEELLDFSINVFFELVSEIIKKGCIAEFMPVLVLPLDCSDYLSFWDDTKPLYSQLSDEPPSIYLLDRDKAKFPAKSEEYRVPVELGLAKVEGMELNTYYRCFRDVMSIENDWEFNRAIYIECYPTQFIF